jgi:hypothetical protein
MSQIYQRSIQLTVGTLDVSDLRVVFKVKRNLKPEPNTCEVRIYNLSQDSRDALEHAPNGKLTVRLEAGYEETGTGQLFLGEARSAWTTWDGPDAITTVSTGDSEQEMREARLRLSVGRLVPVDVALTAMVRELGIGVGNVAQAVALLKTKGVAAMFGPGTALSGNVRRALTDFCRSAGLEWSVQNGQIQILDRNRPLVGKAVELSSDSGLVGSPSVDFAASSKTKKGGAIVKARAFIIPELTPGRLVVFRSRAVRGGYRVEEVEYVCDTHGTDWYANLTCRAY